jgi:small nuclear ribonucleoprotein F
MKRVNINPKLFLKKMKNKIIMIKLKWGIEYKGIFESFDTYMNIRTKKTEEWIDGNKTGFLDEVLIRCNNILYIAKS